MARLQSSPLLRKNRGNASNTDPDAAAPYPEFPLLLLSADTQLYKVGPTKKSVEKKNWVKKKNKKKWQSAGLSCPARTIGGPPWGSLPRWPLDDAGDGQPAFVLDPAFAQTTAKDKPQWTGAFRAPRLQEWVIGWQHSGPYLVLLQASCSINKRILLPCATSHFYFLCSLNGCGRERRHTRITALPVQFDPRIKREKTERRLKLA